MPARGIMEEEGKNEGRMDALRLEGEEKKEDV
jgi:hypothetical protein